MWLLQFFLWVSALHAASSQAPVTTTLCDGRIVLEGPKKVRLADNEKIFICGDSKYPEWSQIPIAEAQLHLKAALQARGFHHAVFHRDSNRIQVDLKHITTIKEVVYEGFTGAEKLNKFLSPYLDPLSPDQLNQIESWTLNRLANLGYPCAKVKAFGNPDTGQVTVFIEDGGKRRISNLKEFETKALVDGVLRRHYAFESQSFYHAWLLNLSSSRIEADGLAQSHFFRSRCEGEDHVELEESVFLGEPRLFRVGIGVDTEEYVIFRSSWKTIRLNKLGSSFQAQIRASFKQQRLSLSSEWYFINPPSRFHFFPSVQIERQSEDRFQSLTSDLKFLSRTRWDSRGSSLFFETGPVFTDTRTLQGIGPADLQFLSFDASFRQQSHDHEFYQSTNRQGWRVELKTSIIQRELYSPISARLLSARVENLWNIGGYEPEVLILGLRAQAKTTHTPVSTSRRNELPVRFRHFLGGVENVRGFGRQELPQEEVGGLSSVFAGIELRTAMIMTASLQPFIFADVGAIGSGPFSIEMPIYWSPGVGLRWESPIGNIRASAAHSYSLGQNSRSPSNISHPQIYISFGKDF